jgi:hypothetical protein
VTDSTLTKRLLGGWHLVTASATNAAGETFYPMGREARGQIVYTPNGSVSVNLMAAGRTRVDSEIVWGVLPEAQIAGLARTYMAYAGHYSVDDAAAVVTHHLQLCLDPALALQPQVRHVRFTESGNLILEAPDANFDGRPIAVGSLEWRHD